MLTFLVHVHIFLGMNTSALIPIKVVETRTGLSEYVIRAWEKRYQAVVPRRTVTNRRLYTEEDVRKLTLLSSLIKTGYPIGQIAKLSLEDLAKIHESLAAVTTGSDSEGIAQYPQEETGLEVRHLLEAAASMDGDRIDGMLTGISLKFAAPVVFERIIVPFLHEIGHRWFQGKIRTADEHFLSQRIRKYLDGYRIRHERADAPVLIVTTPEGLDHDLGALMAAILAGMDGWNEIFLGANLQSEEIAAMAIRYHARAVALSLVYPEGSIRVADDLKRLLQILPDSIPVIAGGRAAVSYAALVSDSRFITVSDFQEYRRRLNDILRGHSTDR